MSNPDAETVACRHCGEPIFWGEFYGRVWLHEAGKTHWCMTRDADNNPLTKAQPPEHNDGSSDA